MAYNSLTDFLGLLRQTSGGVEFARMPGLDYVVAALARAGLLNLSAGQTAPTANQATTAWLRPAQPSWTAEGTLWLWNASTGAYALATPATFSQFLQALSSGYVFQSVGVSAGVIAGGTTLLAVRRAGPAATALTLPALANRGSLPLQIVDWSTAVAGHAITLTTPDGATIMQQSSWSVYSTPDQLGGLTLRPSIDLNGWVIAP